MLKLIVKIAQVIADNVEKEYFSPNAIKKQLSNLEDMLKNGEITEGEYEEMEEMLLDRLDAALGNQN